MRLTSSQYLPLDPKGCRVLSDALGDTPETVISVHSLRRGLCKAYVAGDPSRFDGAVIQWDFLPSEPEGFGSDPKILWDLLKSVKGWDCICVASECANALGQIIEKKMGVRVRYYGDINYILSKPVLNFQNDAVRQLTLKDLKLLESAPAEAQGCGFGSSRGLLSDGIVACAIVSEKIGAIAHTSARTERYADIGVFTLKEWRSRGFATAAASIVARRVQEAGQIPVWSTGEDNIASLRVAQKLGFTEVSRSTFVILDKGK
jgi:GNAT superfamily N-acetyltransferase